MSNQTMTPKEKAKELYDKFLYINLYTMNRNEAKQYALLAVDEILKVAFYTNDEIYEHYIQVKQEIKKL
jgi:hypothetical protein